jgi:hypothetical protein
MDSQDNFFTSQLEQLMSQKDQLFQEYVTLLTFDPILHKEKYKTEIPNIQSKLQKIKVQNNHIQFLLTQQFLQHAKLNDEKIWTESNEQTLVLEHFIKKTNIHKLSKLFIRTPYCIQNKIKEIKKYYNSTFIPEHLENELTQNYTLIKNNQDYLYQFSSKCKRSPLIILDKIKYIEKEKETNALLTLLKSNDCSQIIHQILNLS